MLRSTLTLLCGLALSCAASTPDAPGTAAPATADASDAEAPAAKKDATDEALERVPKILESVASLRSLEIREQIGASRETPEQFRAFVTAELEKELPKEKAATLSTALFRFGLLKKQLDIRKTLEDALVSQVGAYYDPKRTTFFVVMASSNAMFADVMNAHELMHGLQDQHFDLEKLMPEGDDSPLNSDEVTARRFLVEGEATLVMTAYGPYSMSGVNILTNEETGAVMEQQVKQIEKMSIDQMLGMNEQGAATAKELGGDFAKAAESMKELPRYITVPLGMPYMRGMTMVYHVFKKGGWEAVNKLYAAPPSSTEQALHPVEKLIEKRDEPVRLTLPKLPGLETWKEVDADVMGELMWNTYFSIWGVTDGEPAQGWGGDRYAMLHDGDKHVSVVASVWDTPKDAKEFEAGYVATLKARFEGATSTSKGGVTQLTRPDGGTITVKRRKDAVAIVDGAEATVGKQVAAALLKAKRG